MIKDMDRSLRFYVDGLGFVMTRKWIDEGKLRWDFVLVAALQTALGANLVVALQMLRLRRVRRASRPHP